MSFKTQVIELIEKGIGSLRHGTDYESLCQIVILQELLQEISSLSE